MGGTAGIWVSDAPEPGIIVASNSLGLIAFFPAVRWYLAFSTTPLSGSPLLSVGDLGSAVRTGHGQCIPGSASERERGGRERELCAKRVNFTEVPRSGAA